MTMSDAGDWEYKAKNRISLLEIAEDALQSIRDRSDGTLKILQEARQRQEDAQATGVAATPAQAIPRRPEPAVDPQKLALRAEVDRLTEKVRQLEAQLDWNKGIQVNQHQLDWDDQAQCDMEEMG